MKWWINVASALVIFAAGTAPVGAATFTGVLSGAAENPANDSPGTGPVEVELDPVEHVLRVDVTFSGLRSPTTIAHIHCCVPVGENAGVATTVPSFPGFPAGVTSGTYQMTFDTTDASTYNPAFINDHGGTPEGAEAALLAGLTSSMAYFNIHTTMFGAGEIRADLVGGEPATPSVTVAPGTPTGTPVSGTPTRTLSSATATATLSGPTATLTVPAGTATATITPATPAGTPTVTGQATGTATVRPTGEATRTATGQQTGTRTGAATASPTRTTEGGPTRTSTTGTGSPTITVGTRVSTATITPTRAAIGTATRTPAPSTEDDGCNVAAPRRAGAAGAWVLTVPAALLILARRRRR